MNAEKGSPSAASMILLLSMTLVSQLPSNHLSGGDDLEALYISTKMLFAQVQAFASPSLCLIQAGLLISTYERGHGLWEAAYVSVGTCARMAFATGLNRRVTEGQSGREAISQSEEEKNLWWGIVICER
jgi:hypothetical protein